MYTKEKVMPQRSETQAFRWIRAGLATLAFITVVTGCWAFIAPMSFFTSFPLPGHPWVALLSPYNEHLVRDVGEFNLSFTLLFVWAMVSRERRLVQATLLAWLVYAVLHFFYHLAHLAHFPRVDQIAQTIALGIVILLPVVMLVALQRVRVQPAGIVEAHGMVEEK